MSSTDEATTLVLQIIKAKTLFDVLGVSKEASPEEVTKSYKKVHILLSLLY